MKKAKLYCRVSSDDQSNFSLSYQDSTLRSFCERMNIQVTEVIFDQYSAKTFDRPGYQKLAAEIKAKKSPFDIFLFLRWDRFSRNIYNAMHEIKFLQKHGIEIMCHDQPVDLSSPDGKMMLAIYLMSPEIENDKNSIRTREGMRKSKQSGNICGRAPLGYINSKNEFNKSIITIDELKSKFIIRAYEAIAYQGQSKSEVASELKKAKLIGSGRDQVTRILRNVIYAGKVVVPAFGNMPSQIVPGNHQPIISEQLFNTVQQILDGKKRAQKHQSNDEFPLRGVLCCNQCGAMLTASYSRGKMGVKYGYYHCRANCTYRHRSDEVHETMQSLMYELQLSPAFAESYKLVLQDVFKSENSDLPKQITEGETELINLEEMIQNADENLLLNKISVENYNRMIQNIMLKKSKIEQHLSEVREFLLSFNDKLTYSLNAMKNLGEEYFLSDAIAKKNIVSSTFPEKITFQKNQFRTPRINSLMFANASKYGQKETATYNAAVQKLSLTSFGVEYGARTHDLLNHNQAL